MKLKVYKITEDFVQIDKVPVIVKYIRDNFEVTENTVILAYYVNQQNMLKEFFPQCTVDSVTSKSEGVDFSHANNFIIVSSGYSGSKFIQVRDRIVNINGSSTTTVNHILVKKAISDQVYKKVSKKMDFNNQTYLPTRL